MSQTRRLAAILAADVAGYSRLMGADEEGTHERLKAHLRELVDPKIAEHRGHIVKNTGDGFLAEFASVVDAVRCAVEIQHGMSAPSACASCLRPRTPRSARSPSRTSDTSVCLSGLPRRSMGASDLGANISTGLCAVPFVPATARREGGRFPGSPGSSV